MMVNQRVLVLLLVGCLSDVNAGFWSRDDERKTAEQTIDEDVVVQDDDAKVEYGVDVSFPIHYPSVSTNYAWLPHNQDPNVPTPHEYKDMVVQPLGDRQKFYKNFVDGCRESFGAKGIRCTQNEMDRITMSLRQPQSMQNYTDIGFKKIRAPDHVWNLIKEFWEKNKDKQTKENWGIGNTYTNNWASPSYMVSVEDQNLRGGGRILKKAIWDAARDTIQEWTGQELSESSLYGIRVYTEGAVLATHVDRLPLVSSAIINVAQDVDEPWPLEVYGHDGKAVNVTMEPGDMVLYESHSVLHGRPFPLKGRFMANIFIHFEPVGHSLRHNAEQARGLDEAHEKYRESLSRGIGGHENEADGLPSYIVPGSPEETHWRQTHPGGARSKRNSATTGSQQTIAHLAAQQGNMEALQTAVKKNKAAIKARDENGWTPLHEGARGGHIQVVKYLVENGADVNERTGENGGTPLFWAKDRLEPDHPVISYLESLGALDIGPDL